MPKNHFFELTKPDLDGFSGDFTLCTHLYEEEMNRHAGIDLGSINESSKLDDETILRLKNILPHFQHDYEMIFMNGGLKNNPYSTQKIMKRYEKITSPCSMKLKSMKELGTHLTNAYQVSYANYAFGKIFNIKESFPKSCCIISSTNVGLSLLEHGYLNSSIVYKTGENHGYVILPFIIEENDYHGSIIIDPTYEQLWDEQAVRNYVGVKGGDVWKYESDWNYQADLYPDRIISIDILLSHNTPLSSENAHRNTRKYLNEAFSNPIDISSV